MNPKQSKELWRIRFLKVLELEQESFDFYNRLLREKGKLLRETGIHSVLKKIMQDEVKHIATAKELIRLVGGEWEEPR